MSKELFQEIDDYITKIISLLEKQYNLLNKEMDGIQKTVDLQQGIFLQNGIYINIDTIDHSILYDRYEILIIKSFISLYKNIFNQKENLFTEFAIRTLIEIAFYRTQIIFGNDTTKEEKQHFILLLMLADYGFLSTRYPTNMERFIKLFNENKNLLTEKELKKIEEFLKNKDTSNPYEKLDQIQNFRKMIDYYQKDLKKKLKLLPEINNNALIELSSSFSHLLHGNTLLIDNLFSEKTTYKKHLLRIYQVLLVSGYNTTSYISNYLNKSDINTEMIEIKKDYILLVNKLRTYWKEIKHKQEDFKLHDIARRILL